MKLEIFNVEHGACALLTNDHGQRMMIDCGHNTSTGWKPGTYLKSIGVHYLEMLWITNYDEDHVSGINDLLDNVIVDTFGRNTDISPALITHLKRNNTPGPGIARLIDTLSKCSPPGVTPPGRGFPVVHGVTTQSFWNPYPQFQDENNLSLVLKITFGGTVIMFTGDMELSGWKALLQRTDFQNALAGIDIYVASHHGREDGYCEEMFKHFTPNTPRFVVVSDKSIVHETQKSGPLYAAKAFGGNFNGENNRKLITTRSDGSMVIVPNALAQNFTFSKL